MLVGRRTLRGRTALATPATRPEDHQLPGGIFIATGELYNVNDDPYQWDNKWDDEAVRALRDDLVADLYDSLPVETRHLKVVAPA